MWERIKRWFGGTPAPESVPKKKANSVGFSAPRPDLAGQMPSWIAAAENPWGVSVLDVRPMTLGTLSTSKDPKMAENAVSYGGESGRSFVDQPPQFDRQVEGSLRFSAPPKLVDGSLFIPQQMEDKWALFVQRQTLIVVRGWQRKVFLSAALRVDGSFLDVTDIKGAVAHPQEEPEYTLRALDFILRTHALELDWPAPLVGIADLDPRVLAIQCMSNFGRHASWGSFEAPARDIPKRPLRTVTELHRAALHNDVEAARKALADGVPVDVPESLGYSALHCVTDAGPLLALLLQHNADVNLAGDDGTTPLMAATQTRRTEVVKSLLSHGAAPDAVDARGFSALHRAAEMGLQPIVALLLERGADPDRATSSGHTPRSLAQGRGNQNLFSSPAK
jgi:hypothetical protein